MFDQRPRIGLPTPTSDDPSYNERCLPDYVAAIEQSGGSAIVLPLSADLNEYPELDGVVLPGSPADVNPELYGQGAGEKTAVPDAARERTDFALLQAASSRFRPVLAICFGLQSVNVWRGGSLLQDLPLGEIDHAAGPSVASAHSVFIEENSVLAKLACMGEDRASHRTCVDVNSSHHQATERLGEGLRVVARSAADGVIEALEWGDTLAPFPLIAVQWHPERSTLHSPLSRNLFAWLIEQARPR